MYSATCLFEGPLHTLIVAYSHSARRLPVGNAPQNNASLIWCHIRRKRVPLVCKWSSRLPFRFLLVQNICPLDTILLQYACSRASYSPGNGCRRRLHKAECRACNAGACKGSCFPLACTVWAHPNMILLSICRHQLGHVVLGTVH